jgi:hypothetical protein
MASGILGSVQHRLPTELVLVIIEHVADDNDNNALCNLARTCRALQHLAEARLYRTIQLLSVNGLHRIVEAFTSRRERVRAVHTLKIQYQWRPDLLDSSVDVRKAFNDCAVHMVNLREWHIESPYDNFHWEAEGGGGVEWVGGDMERFRVALEGACTEGPLETRRIQEQRSMGSVLEPTVGLALLQRLTIHSHGANSDFWDLGGFHCLFRHPNLQHLHISCVAFPQDLPELEHHTKKTPLTTLVFDECDLEPSSLLAVLRTPAKLKHLTLGENVWNVSRSKRIEPKLSKNASASLEALSAVAHSLETLTHTDPGWRLDSEPHRTRRTRPPGQGMRNFHALRRIQCETSSFLHQAVIMNHEIAPPNLDTLRLCRHWNVSTDFFDSHPEIESYLALPSLKILELVQSSPLWHELSRSEYICDGERMQSRHAYAYKLYKAGINLKVFIELHKGSNLIPPYLFDEPTPILHCVYDASDVGFRRHIRIFDKDLQTKVAGSAEAAATWKESMNLPEGSEGGVLEDDKWMGGYAPRSIEAQWGRFFKPTTSGEPPETDQLGEIDCDVIRSKTRRALEEVKTQFVRYGRVRAVSSVLGSTDEDEDPFDQDIEDDEELDDEDMEVDLDMDEDELDALLHMNQQDAQLFLELYEMEADDDEGEFQDAMDVLLFPNDHDDLD